MVIEVAQSYLMESAKKISAMDSVRISNHGELNVGRGAGALRKCGTAEARRLERKPSVSCQEPHTVGRSRRGRNVARTGGGIASKKSRCK